MSGFNYKVTPHIISLDEGVNSLATIVGNSVVCSFAVTVIDVTGGAVEIQDIDGNTASITKESSYMYGGQAEWQVNTAGFVIIVPTDSKAILSWEV